MWILEKMKQGFFGRKIKKMKEVLMSQLTRFSLKIAVEFIFWRRIVLMSNVNTSPLGLSEFKFSSLHSILILKIKSWGSRLLVYSLIHITETESWSPRKSHKSMKTMDMTSGSWGWPPSYGLCICLVELKVLSEAI